MSNYLQHFGLERPVFKREKRPYLFVSDQLRQAEQEFRAAFEDSYSVLTVSGPIGSGKTTAVVHALSHLDGETVIIRLGRVRLEPDEVLDLMLTELGIGELPNGTIRKLGKLGEKVSSLQASGSRLVIMVEDAARTGAETLAELEVICSGDGGFDIGLIVCGDETLPKQLQDGHLKRLTQRVSAHLNIAALAVDEMEDYLFNAVTEAGGQPSKLLGNDVPALLHILSCGVPRLANKLIESSLKKAASDGESRLACALLADVAEARFGITTEIPIKRNTPKPSANSAQAPANSGPDAATGNAPAVPEKPRTESQSRPRNTKPPILTDSPADTGSQIARKDVLQSHAPTSVDADAQSPVDAKAIPATAHDPATPPALTPSPEPASVADGAADHAEISAANSVAAASPPDERQESAQGPEPRGELAHDDTATELILSRNTVLEPEAKAEKEDLPYLIQDTQPALATLDPDTAPESEMDGLNADPHSRHEMLPDLDELAAELASAVSAAPDAAEPEVGIPELPMDPSSLEPEPAIEQSAPDSGLADSVPTTDPGRKPEQAADEAPNPVEQLTEPADDEELYPTIAEELDPEPTIAEELDPDPVSQKTPTLAREATLTTSDEAALISALADEHNATSTDDDRELGFEETTVKVVDTSTPTLDAAAVGNADDVKTHAPASDDSSVTKAVADVDEPVEVVLESASETGAEIAGNEALEAALSDADGSPISGATTSGEDDDAAPVSDQLEPVAEVENDVAVDQDPSLVLELLEEPEPSPQVAPPAEDAVVIHDADRDPTLAQLKPDLDALEMALAENFVPDGTEPADDDSGEPEEDGSGAAVPAITLDDSIHEKVAAETEELARRDAEIAAQKKAAEKKAATGKSNPGPSDTDVHQLAAELQRTSALEDMDDRLAETLFGDEINMVASQVLKEAREHAEKTADEPAAQAPAPTPKPAASATTGSDDPDIKKQFEEVWGQVPDENESIDLKSARPNSGLDMSASQRLATVRALNAGMGTPPPPTPAGKKPPSKPKDAPVPIEDQIDISMTNTMKALNIDPKILEQPAQEEDAPKGGFFSRFRKKG